jgi:hemerythrin-like domain-containing protein
MCVGGTIMTFETMAKRLDLEHEAQNKIMQGMQANLSKTRKNGDTSKQVLVEMEAQFKRVEQMFGYDPNSWRVGV